MDYSKHGTIKKQKKIRSSIPKAKHKVSFNIFRVVVFCLIALLVMGVAAGVGGFKGIIDSAPDITAEDVIPQGYKSFIYDKDGNLLTQLYQPETNRIYVDIEEIPEVLQNAFIALEDERFWDHNGIDPKGIVRAFFVGVTSGDFSEGASTITQQLLKLNVFGGGNEENLLLKFKRKFQEQYLALELEKKMSKEKILEAYLNTINLGASTYGVEAASQRYFGKSCSEVNASEAAVLASIAKSPTYYDPITYPEENKARRDRTLGNMLDQGYLTQEEYDTAMADDVYTRIAEHAETTSDTQQIFTYYEDAAIRQVLEDLEEKLGYTEEQAINKLYGGGLRVYLAQDDQIQDIVDEEFADNSNFANVNTLGLTWRCSVQNEDGTVSNYDEQTMQYYFWNNGNNSFQLLYNNEEEARADIQAYKDALGITEDQIIAETFDQPYALQSSFVIMDQKTGEVKAIAGGRNEKKESLSFSRETQSTRQPGSCFKILACYLPGIDSGAMTLASSETDSPYTTASGYSPENWWDGYGRYGSTLTARMAITQSANVVTTKFYVEDVGADLAIDYMQKLGITTLTENDYVESLALGGLYNGVTNLEMTGAYAAIANGGEYVRPVFYTKVIDRDGNVILDNSNQEGEQVIKESTAYLLTSAMQDVVTKGTGTAANMYDGMDIAGKTGTTNDSKDLWFVGYTPYYTAGIWLGYDQAYPMENLPGVDPSHEYLWAKIMRRIDSECGLENASFEIPSSVGTRTVCSISGKLPSAGCPTITEYFDLNTLPTERCNDHVSALICDVCGNLANENSPSASYKSFTNASDVPSSYCTCPPQTEESTETPGTAESPSESQSESESQSQSDSPSSPGEPVTPEPPTGAVG